MDALVRVVHSVEIEVSIGLEVGVVVQLLVVFVAKIAVFGRRADVDGVSETRPSGPRSFRQA